MHYPLRPKLAAYHGKDCPYCLKAMKVNPRAEGSKGNRSPTRDHIIPRSHGGRKTLVCCQRCNIDKADRNPHEWLSHLEVTCDPRAETLRIWLKRNPQWNRKNIPLSPYHIPF